MTSSSNKTGGVIALIVILVAVIAYLVYKTHNKSDKKKKKSPGDGGSRFKGGKVIPGLANSSSRPAGDATRVRGRDMAAPVSSFSAPTRASEVHRPPVTDSIRDTSGLVPAQHAYGSGATVGAASSTARQAGLRLGAHKEGVMFSSGSQGVNPASAMLTSAASPLSLQPFSDAPTGLDPKMWPSAAGVPGEGEVGGASFPGGAPTLNDQMGNFRSSILADPNRNRVSFSTLSGSRRKARNRGAKLGMTADLMAEYYGIQQPQAVVNCDNIINHGLEIDPNHPCLEASLEARALREEDEQRRTATGLASFSADIMSINRDYL